ncbi:helix-turn-helix domain-containing protein [uncultured Albimonas sp.]|uniref:TetR/AcrR family transcriptional regulator n=1 Tax=uncultured Albimonas sp. TaxID=1331701 RepID=UPI0030ED97CA|tara:strand:+ start:2009 stop:2737 length:729 start_codon:yes stop_codon:yes gene_type:complete
MATDTTRDRIKSAARRLFAMRGLDAVSIRDIATASGQKSSGAVNYHFRSREELIKEIARDVMRVGDARRVERMDEIEARGGPGSLREVIEVMVDDDTLDAASRAQDDHGLRFLHSVMINRRDLLFEALRDGSDQGTRRCMAHIGRFAGHLPPVIVRQRLMLVISHLFAAAVSREAARFAKGGIEGETLWGHPAAKSNLIDTVEGIMTAPASPETLRLLEHAPAPTPADPADSAAVAAISMVR